MVLKFEDLVRTFCYDCEDNSFTKCYHCFGMYKEKHNMSDRIEINVKVNGEKVPLYEVSEQTLLTIREASKPKPVPALGVCQTKYGESRLIFKMPKNVKDYAGAFVFIDDIGHIQGWRQNGTEMNDESFYMDIRELKLGEL